MRWKGRGREERRRGENRLLCTCRAPDHMQTPQSWTSRLLISALQCLLARREERREEEDKTEEGKNKKQRERARKRKKRNERKRERRELRERVCNVMFPSCPKDFGHVVNMSTFHCKPSEKHGFTHAFLR